MRPAGSGVGSEAGCYGNRYHLAPVDRADGGVRAQEAFENTVSDPKAGQDVFASRGLRERAVGRNHAIESTTKTSPGPVGGGESLPPDQIGAEEERGGVRGDPCTSRPTTGHRGRDRCPSTRAPILARADRGSDEAHQRRRARAGVGRIEASSRRSRVRRIKPPSPRTSGVLKQLLESDRAPPAKVATPDSADPSAVRSPGRPLAPRGRRPSRRRACPHPGPPRSPPPRRGRAGAPSGHGSSRSSPTTRPARNASPLPTG